MYYIYGHISCLKTPFLAFVLRLYIVFLHYRFGGRSDGGSRGRFDRDRGGGSSRGGFDKRGPSSRGGRPSLKGSQPGQNLRKPRWDLSRLPKFEKNFYKEHPNVARRSQVCFSISYIWFKLVNEANHQTFELIVLIYMMLVESRGTQVSKP